MTENGRLEKELCWEIGLVQQCKHGQKICGDHIVITQDGDRVRIVLSDGLGSGVQANIASTLTATLVSGMTEKAFHVEDCLRAMTAVLPTTKKQNLAYATFTLVSAEGHRVRLVQVENPPAVFLRDGVSLDYPYTLRTVEEKTLQESVLTMKSGDMLVLFSDGVSEAGRGVTTYAGWDRREMEDYLFRSIEPDEHARRVAASIVSTVQALDLFEYHDDTTVAVLRLRERLKVNLLVGPSDGWEPASEVLQRFFALEGQHAICGKGASEAAARFLGKKRIVLPGSDDGTPSVSVVEDIDLCVEGEETFREAVAAIGRSRLDGMLSLVPVEELDGISQLSDLLAEQASDVAILFCPTHSAQGESSPGSDRKSELVLQLQKYLSEMGKTVILSYC